ncbi:MAG: hypothetical protein J2P49_06615 [Methylocapsa sp.]|nr:hypothetical protein [Methylocapsa sp.]
MFEPGGFYRPLKARQRQWRTATAEANFTARASLAGPLENDRARHDVPRLTTFRSQGQFNTSIYSYRDRLRGVSGTRMAVFMDPSDIDRFGLKESDQVSLAAAADDSVRRETGGFIVHAYAIPEGCIGGYYPECNPLVPVRHHAKECMVPAVNCIPARVQKSGIFVPIPA